MIFNHENQLISHEIEFKNISLGISEKSSNYTHNLHKYYAKLIPQIPRYLIERYSGLNDIILDPFCGSGTTLVEAKILGRNCIGLDINPLAILISRVKTSLIDIKELEMVVDLVKDEINNRSSGEKVVFQNIEHWFGSKARSELERLKTSINILKPKIDETIYRFLLVCFSSIIRRCSYADSTISKIYKSKKVLNKIKGGWEPQPIKFFMENTQKYAKKIINYSNSLNGNKTFIKLFEEDANLAFQRFQTENIDSVDLILTSPPYINAQNYLRTYKLELFWLDLISPPELLNLNKKIIGNEITSENDLNIKPTSKIPELNSILSKVWLKNRKRAYIIFNYFESMKKIIQSTNNLLKKNGIICLIIGNNTICGYKVPTNVILLKLFLSNGFKLIEVLKDTIKRRSLNPNRNHNCGFIIEEWILILQKL